MNESHNEAQESRTFLFVRSDNNDDLKNLTLLMNAYVRIEVAEYTSLCITT